MSTRQEKLNSINKNVLELIPVQFALEHVVLPLENTKNELRIAMKNTQDYSLLQDLSLLTGMNIIPIQFPEEEILISISKNYNVKLSKNNGRKQVKEFKVVQKSEEQTNNNIEIKDDSSVILHINEIITKAINDGASDIHFEAYEKRFRIRYRLDGKLKEVNEISIQKKQAYISRIKIMAELDIAEKRRPQDGRIRMQGGGKTVDIRVSTMPTDFGEKIVLRLLDKTALKLDMNNIGFTKEMKIQFEKVLQLPYGMILVTGPTGSGKTTTLYTALSSINSPEVNIMTIEDPIEYNLEGINQAHVRADIGFTFANALRSFLRQDPDIIMVGEIRDTETAEIAIRSSLTGHLVLSTLHTNDAPSAITRLMDMGIEPFLVANSLKIVIAQRLVRKICKHCRSEDTIDLNILKNLGVKNSDNFICFKGSGCDQCGGTGFNGRTALIEMLPITDQIIELINRKAPAAEIRETAVSSGMLTLRHHGIEKLKAGETTLQEVLRETLI